MNKNEFINQMFYEVCSAVEQRIKAGPFCIVAIGGGMGVGKTALSRYLSYTLRLSLLEADLFLRSIEAKVRYDYKYIQEILDSKRKAKRHIVVEGLSILPVLSKFESSEIFLIHIENKIPSSHSPVELIDWGNTEYCPIKEIPNVNLSPDCPSALKAKASHTINWQIIRNNQGGKAWR